MVHRCLLVFFFFFNDTATTEIYTLSLHDALPICSGGRTGGPDHDRPEARQQSRCWPLRGRRYHRRPSPSDNIARRGRHRGELTPVSLRGGRPTWLTEDWENDRALCRPSVGGTRHGRPGGSRIARRSEERRVGKECRAR